MDVILFLMANRIGPTYCSPLPHTSLLVVGSLHSIINHMNEARSGAREEPNEGREEV